ncbi:MAG: TIGR02530 family flagellar biosynthesis protein [Anaerolineaceae bacterium]|nr:TIGR02530 family flagellar biosynthesis protein [Anaerolineaceae bacterium]
MSASFRVQLDQVNVNDIKSSPAANSTKLAGGSTFADALANAQDVHFSNHAQKRLESRSITLTDSSVSRLSNAINKAEKRGGKSSLVLMDDMAFIVNVPDRTVVTAMNANSRGEGVFTQIDSVVFADPASQSASSYINAKA